LKPPAPPATLEIYKNQYTSPAVNHKNYNPDKMKPPVRVAVTGAAGQISYSLAFRIASGAMLGPSQPVILQLLEIPPALGALNGAVMELGDCAFPLLREVVATDDPAVAFGDANYALLVGAKPRTADMQRSDLIKENAAIFSAQGKALNDSARRNVKVLVVGNPANTNALIARHNAPDIPAAQFTAMTRLDHNRAIAMLAAHTGAHTTDIKRMIVWGNHSATQYPDLTHATVNGRLAARKVKESWVREQFIPRVQNRGTEVIRARGASSAASAAAAAIDHMRDWALGTADGDWVSMGIPSDGKYDIAEGVVFSYPVTCTGGKYRVVQSLPIDEFSRARLDASDAELRQERDAVKQLL